MAGRWAQLKGQNQQTGHQAGYLFLFQARWVLRGKPRAFPMDVRKLYIQRKVTLQSNLLRDPGWWWVGREEWRKEELFNFLLQILSQPLNFSCKDRHPTYSSIFTGVRRGLEQADLLE